MLQAEAAEFGLACLAMVAAFHGQRRSLSELRRLFSASIKGTTLKSLMDMADGLGFTARPVRLEVGLRLATLSLENSNDHCRYEK
ncbi:MAG: cysteine peptidase family C39 domain-containing protein [Hyphomonadaceae bacterium]|nr:cysteine peptidase family C39 domain-containing protein [Hyphomonadaceae bacterium]